MILVDHQSRISKNFFVYVLRSLVDGTFYIGSTSNINERLKQHNQGKSRYTRGHRPYELIYSESFPSRVGAETREKAIKKYGNTKNFLKSRVPPTP
ncbi:endonuclease [Candidatus Roizmanbacteria bacterium CG10_big_fil_rev_8_21_14_0_10_39_6]|uniref:Endonuclease n=1 Tax=Candidatus Roizmanbacteria bacterium CG10_big_fil_rev_8_21_14_0_10_39_6 TaxID=1974853 RepID=A0A2M8KTK4_9BACT|nr:MAG: endonuclease [Candidatus Roizmanbacteria bacterium CG10_big_fil_rev_8_21_14_0_10_39_6]